MEGGVREGGEGEGGEIGWGARKGGEGRVRVREGSGVEVNDERGSPMSGSCFVFNPCLLI